MRIIKVTYVNSDLSMLMRKKKREDRKMVVVNKHYEMSDKNSLFSDYDNVSMNNILRIRSENNIIKLNNFPQKPKVIIDFNEVSSNSDIDPLLMTTEPDKKTKRLNGYKELSIPSSSRSAKQQVFFPVHEERNNIGNIYNTNNFCAYPGYYMPINSPYVYSPNIRNGFKQPNSSNMELNYIKYPKK
jgi:hypothetical protein